MSKLMVLAVVTVGGLASQYGMLAWYGVFKARPSVARNRRSYHEGGFQTAMTRREAALILGVREEVVAEKVKEAHRRAMVANHPDVGGSHYLASKINEAKYVMLGKSNNSRSAF